MLQIPARSHAAAGDGSQRRPITRRTIDTSDPKYTQAKIAAALGVAQSTVSDWLKAGTSNTGAGNACNRSATQTVESERTYFLADARVKLDRRAAERLTRRGEGDAAAGARKKAACILRLPMSA